MEKVAGLLITVDAKQAKEAAEMLDRLVKSAEGAETSLKNLKTLATETAPTIEALARVVETSRTAMTQMGDVMKAIAQASEEARRSSNRLTTSVEKFSEQTTQASAKITELSQSMQVSSTVAEAGAKSAKELENATQDVAKATEEAKVTRDRLTVGLRNSAEATKRNEAENSKLESRVRSLNKELARKENYLVRIAKRAFVAAAGVWALNKAVQVVRDNTKIIATYETIGSQLEFVSGSARGAAETMSFLRVESDKAGVSLRESTKLFGSLQFSLQEVGVSAQTAKDIFTGVGAAAATFGMSTADTNGILTAFVQMANKGVVSSQELRNQIGSRLPGAFSMAADAMGMTTIELSKAMEQGQVMANDLMPKLAKALNETFGPDLERQADNINGAINRLNNAWDGFILSVIDSKPIKDTLNTIADLLKLITFYTQDSPDQYFLDLVKRNRELTAAIEATNQRLENGEKLQTRTLQVHRRRINEQIRVEREMRDFIAARRGERESQAEADAARERARVNSAADLAQSAARETFEVIDALRQTDLERELAAGEKRKAQIGKNLRDIRAMLAEASLDEGNRTALLAQVKQLEALDPFAGLAERATAAWTTIIDRNLSDAERLTRQYETDVSAVIAANEALIAAYGENARFEINAVLEDLVKSYWEAMGKLNEVQPDLTGLKTALSDAIAAASNEASAQSKAIGTLEGAVGGDNLLGNLFGLSGAAERLRSEFAALTDVYESEKELIMNLRREGEESEVELEKRKLERLLELNTRYRDNLKQLDAVSNSKQVEAFDQLQDDLLTLAKAGSKEMAAVFKAVAIANTIIKTYESAQNAFTSLSSIPYIGPALGAAAAGAAIAAGMARVQAIRSTNYSGAYERGGMIPAGSMGLVGEAGPEMVRGPAIVTSARNTADRMGNGQTKVNVVVNNHSGAKASVRESRNGAGELTYEVFIERVERELAGRVASGGTPLGQSMEQAYALRRGTL